jgi:hypothetical protein
VAECAEVLSQVSPREARLILEPYYEALQAQFAEAGFDRVEGTKLRCSEDMHDTPRHFAGCATDGSVIYVAPQLVELPESTVLGILAHELGHAADFLYPAEFLLRGDHVVLVEEPDKYLKKGWKQRDDDTVELVADGVAEFVLGVSIGYRGPCRLQSLGVGGGRRPLGLR